MKKIISLFIICLLALGLVACEKGGKSGKELEVARLDQDKLGLYYGASDATCEVKESSVVFNDNEFTVYTSGDGNYLIKVEEAQISVKFEGAKVTIGDMGTFTKRVKANVSEANQGVYAEETDVTKTAILRANSIKVDGKEYTLFEDATGVYYVSGDKEVYLTFSTVLTMATVSVNGKTYIITNMPLPAEDGELTKLVKKIIAKFEDKALADFALEASATAEAKQTITKGEKDPSKIDLIGAILGDLKLSANGSVTVKDIDLEDLSKLLAVASAHVEATIAGQTNVINVQANVQDGKVLTKQWGEDVAYTEYECEDLPESVDVDTTALEFIGLDAEELFAKLAEVEAELAKIGVTFSDVQSLLSKVFSLTEKEIKINITKSDAIAVLAAVKLMANSKLDAALSIAWDELPESQKAAYPNENAFKDEVVTKINEGLAEAEAFINSLTINKCKIEFNFETLVGLIDIDVVVPGKDTDEAEDGTETVICEYNTAIKLHLELKSVEVKEITKVNPDDYVISYEDVQELVNTYFSSITLPALSDNVNFDIDRYVEDDELSLYIKFDSVTEAETKAIVNAFNSLSEEIGEDSLSAYFEILKLDTITECEIYAYQKYNDKGEPSGEYRLTINIEIYDNDLSVVQTNIGDGISVRFSYENGETVWANDQFSGVVTWNDDSKVVYVKQNNQIMAIVSTSDGAFSFNYADNGVVTFELAEMDNTLISIAVNTSSYYALPIGPAYVHTGDTVTYKLIVHEDWKEEVGVFDLYDVDSVTIIARNLTDGSEFNYTVPNEPYIYLYLDQQRTAESE